MVTAGDGLIDGTKVLENDGLLHTTKVDEAEIHKVVIVVHTG
jgi:hypothetical protein